MTRPRMVVPRARYPLRDIDRAVVLHKGDNASTDLYLRPRLERLGVPVVYADLESDPAAGLKGAQSALIVICRYASREWLEALRAAAPNLARCAFFMDDDLVAVVGDNHLPSTVRGKTAAHYARQVEGLSAVCGEAWVSTPALAERYPGARVIAPVPDFEPPTPSGPEETRIVYHGTDVHEAERRFVLEVARGLAEAGCEARIEITGGETLRRQAAGLVNVDVTPQLSWPDYRAAQAGRRAAISLAPLFSSVVNDARSHVKAFDAARLGAAGLYAEARPYREFVRAGGDGVLAPMQVLAWVEAIQSLLADPAWRMAIAEDARHRLSVLRRAPNRIPPPPA
ncbi:MAG: hypothetical protein ACXW3D_03955 [Caulobacteraceae bacterium]